MILHECKSINNKSITSIESKDCKLDVLPEIGFTISNIRFLNKSILYFPMKEEEYKNEKRLAGNPFLHPWVNRLREEKIIWKEEYNWDKKDTHIIRYQNGLPIHGLLLKSSRWTYEKNENQILGTYIFNSKEELNIFPFEHKIQMKYELNKINSNCEINVQFKIENLSSKEMPVVSGFHPYFSTIGYNKKDIKIVIPPSMYWENDSSKIPTGKLKNKKEILHIQHLDHVFTDFNNQTFSLIFPDYSIEIIPEKDMDQMVVFSPEDKDFICIEPMTAPTNAFELYKNKYFNNMKTVKPGKYFQTGFSIKLRPISNL